MGASFSFQEENFELKSKLRNFMTPVVQIEDEQVNITADQDSRQCFTPIQKVRNGTDLRSIESARRNSQRINPTALKNSLVSKCR